MRKRHVKILDVFVVYPNNWIGVDNHTVDVLADCIVDGYDIESAVPLSTAEFSGVQYILVKETNE